ncbi:MAG: gliding motility-associated C-terminal domain-containing protein [Salibacteraceae bacterium]
MKEQDKIKEIFKERFESFEAPVDSKIWSGIESQIGIHGASTWISGVSNTLVSVAATAIVVVGISLYSFVDQNEVSNPKVLTSNPSEKVLNNQKETKKVPSSPTEKNTSENIIETKSPQDIENNLRTQKYAPSDKTLPNDDLELAEKNAEEKELVITTKVNEPSMDQSGEINIAESNVISNAPQEIVVEEQSKVLATPSGGVAPLAVNFSAISDVSEVKWKFDDGTESTELNPTHEFEEPGIYFVTMLAKLSDGSAVMDKAVIEVKKAPSETAAKVDESSIFVPNVFTPNGDGENDYLKVVTKEIHSYSISIYSVNGKLVYQNDNPEQNWDGRDLSGNRVEDGTYYYLINALGNDQRVYTPKGYLTIRGVN